MNKFILSIASLFIMVGCSQSPNGELVFVDAGENEGFHFPYFLFIPDDVGQNEKVHLIVHPNNSGFADDDLQKHIDKAQRTATKDFYLGNYVAMELNYPLLVPVFPRSRTNWKIYTHSLDRDVMIQKDDSLERIDLQLIEMFQDARHRLERRNIESEDRFLLTGFSASATFANRFAVIHPELVSAVAAGGLNGLLMLPLDSLKGEALNYPVGTNDLNKLTAREFDRDRFLKIPQFYFMGEMDDNDAIPFEDAFEDDERHQIYRLLGRQMQPERWDNCAGIYKTQPVNAVIKTYESIGHEAPEIVKEEIVEFFRTRLNIP
ncbi:MAG: hypothetical protein ACQEQ0_14955 [Bacteroidota bacterium]